MPASAFILTLSLVFLFRDGHCRILVPPSICADEPVTLVCMKSLPAFLTWDLWLHDRWNVIGTIIPMDLNDNRLINGIMYVAMSWIDQNNNFVISNLTFVPSYPSSSFNISCTGVSAVRDSVLVQVRESLSPNITCSESVLMEGIDNVTISIHCSITNVMRVSTSIYPITGTIHQFHSFFTMYVFNITIAYNEEYTVNISAHNCDLMDMVQFKLSQAKCPLLNFGNIAVISMNGTTEGASVLWHCISEVTSFSPVLSVCLEDSSWDPDINSLNCTGVCKFPELPLSLTLINTVNRTYVEMEVIYFRCNHGQSKVIMSTCLTNGSWSIDPSSFDCINLETETTASTEIIVSSYSDNNSSIIGGAIGGIIFLLLVFLLTVCGIVFILKKDAIILRLKCSGDNKSRHVEEPSDTEYAVTLHNINSGNKAQDVYSHLNQKQGLVSSCAKPPLVYADIQSYSTNRNVVPDAHSKVLYSGICQIPEASHSDDLRYMADKKLNLDTISFQLSEIEHLWYSYGEAIGVPQNILAEVNGMNCGDHEKLVEVIDYWIYTIPKKQSLTWNDVAKFLDIIGQYDLAGRIRDVYNTGELPVKVDDDLDKNFKIPHDIPPPLPPKPEDDTVVSNGNSSEELFSHIPPLPPKLSTVKRPQIPPKHI